MRARKGSRGERARPRTLSFELNSRLVELGNVLIIFFAGLESETQFFLEYWTAIVPLGPCICIFSLFPLPAFCTLSASTI